MRINYHRQHNHRRHFSRVLLTLFVLSILIAILSWLGALTGFIRTAYMHTDNMVTSIEEGAQGTFSLFTPKTSLIQENQQLHSKLQILKIAELHLEALEQENTDLRNLFINTQPVTKDSLLARIIDYSNAPYGTLLTAIESGAEVQKGSLAHFGKWAIGSVAEVNGSVVLITLFNASGSAYDVLVGDTVATFTGASNGIGKVILPRTETIEIGTIVTLPSQKGLLLGTVESVEVTEEAALQTIFVRTPLNMRSLRFITIDTE